MKKLLTILLVTGITLSLASPTQGMPTTQATANSSRRAPSASPIQAIPKASATDKRIQFLTEKLSQNISQKERAQCIEELNARYTGHNVKATLIKYSNVAKIGLAIIGTIGAAWLFKKANAEFKSYLEAENLYTEAVKNIDTLVNTPQAATKKLCWNIKNGHFCSTIAPLGEKAMKYFEENNRIEHKIRLLKKMNDANTQLPNVFGWGKGVQTNNQFMRELNKLSHQ